MDPAKGVGDCHWRSSTFSMLEMPKNLVLDLEYKRTISPFWSPCSSSTRCTSKPCRMGGMNRESGHGPRTTCAFPRQPPTPGPFPANRIARADSGRRQSTDSRRARSLAPQRPQRLISVHHCLPVLPPSQADREPFHDTPPGGRCLRDPPRFVLYILILNRCRIMAFSQEGQQEITR